MNINSRVLNAAIGGWTIVTVNTISSGSPNMLSGGRLTFDAYGTTPTGADGGAIFSKNINSLLNATSTALGGFDKTCTCIRTAVQNLTLSNAW